MRETEAGARAQDALAEPLCQSAIQEVASLFRQLIAAAGNGHGAPGIARVLHQHTGKPVTVEGPNGQLLGASVPEGWPDDAGTLVASRPLPENASHAVAMFDLDRWVAVARPRGEVLGAISLLDSKEPTTSVDIFELEQATTVLAWELLHVRSLAEAEVALWGDFATELLEDSDLDRLRSHAERLGYDLDEPYRAVLILPGTSVPTDARDVISRAGTRLGFRVLATTRGNGIVLIVAHDLAWADLPKQLLQEAECQVRVGVGGRYPLGEVKRSLADAEFALTLPSPAVDRTVAVFDELGVWRLLARPDGGDLQDLVDQWIGPLIDYDREHRSELLKTLIAYLNEFGALEVTASKLFVHRNSLRYRLVRISELTGWDLNDPDQRFHLDLACRAWQVRQALAALPHTNGAGAAPAANGNAVAKSARLLGRRATAFASKGAAKAKPRRAGMV